MKRIRILLFILAAVLCLAAALSGEAETKTFRSVAEAVKYVRANQPAELTLENVKFKPAELLKIKNELPEGAEFHFTAVWGKINYSDETEEMDLTVIKDSVSAENLEAIVKICPKVRHIDNSSHRSPSNKVMIPLTEKYPDVQFEWQVHLGHGHYVKTTWTAFSTFLEPGSGRELTSENLELLKYCPRLKALDVGHNKVKNLEFLQYVPDLELLIIGQNYVKDITPVGQLKHLQYAELFTNSFTDLSPLENCTELIDLNLTNCQITSLKALENITTIERLWLNMIHSLPQEEVDRFISMHPDCEVSFHPSRAATNYGWRSNSKRYKHYIWCLKNHQWIPFDQPLPTK